MCHQIQLLFHNLGQIYIFEVEYTALLLVLLPNVLSDEFNNTLICRSCYSRVGVPP